LSKRTNAGNWPGCIQQKQPSSVYELARMFNNDQSTLNKLIIFFEQRGVIRIMESRVGGRAVKTPKVDLDGIEFKMNAA